ncbi:ribosomal L22e protein family [Actinidia rufa]|uniref:Large ribosomal subunit protein eL22 n=1 Tax=Actinidia rufa TaxID=165716 RepID=A0A7J0GG57_9ERIC|nr:ribosomal L22e protein family [Actinidia rufa]
MSRGTTAGPKGKKKGATFVINHAKLVEDKIMEIASLEKFLQAGIKAGALEDSVIVTLARRTRMIMTSLPRFVHTSSVHLECPIEAFGADRSLEKPTRSPTESGKHPTVPMAAWAYEI